ncbi:hypothetical protein MNV49_004859 [Pseudohyphozyma bogoriensis]|nr:hypothetical protein MNV49_004859 [Pseudohyphozyma bogoriensis]
MAPRTPTSLINGDFKAWVTSGGRKLSVYALEVKGSKATGYIEARAGEEFQTTLQPFEFSKLSVVAEEEQSTASETFLKNLGRISLRLERVTEIKPVDDLAQNINRASASQSVHEATKKATLSHQTRLGESQPCTPRRGYRCQAIDPKDKPWYDFEFQYLSRDLLEMKGLVQRSSPRPSGL